MFQFLNCPACDKPARVPVYTKPATRLRCPRCQAIYTVGELSERIASWEILPPDPAAAAQPYTGSAPSQESFDYVGSSEPAGDEFRLADAESTERSKKNSDWSSFEPLTHEQYESMKRKSRSPLWSIAQVVLGGVAAVPIALLLIWHVIGTDIGEAGPRVGKYVPWIVPEKFRPVDRSLAQRKDAAARQASRERGANGFRQFDDVLPLNDSSQEEATAEEGDDSLPPAKATTEVRDGGSSGEEVAQPSPRMSNDGNGATETQNGTPMPDNIFALIHQADTDLKAWAGAVQSETDDLKSLAQTIYGNFVALARAIEKLPSDHPVTRSVRDQMRTIGRTVNRREDVQSLVRQGAVYWRQTHPPAPDAPTPLAIVVELEAVSEGKERWTVSARAPHEHSIHIPKLLAPQLLPGQKLLLLGYLEIEDESAPETVTFSANYLYGL